MSEHPIVWVFAAMLLLVGALQQIGTGLYYPIKMTETIRDFFLISIALTLLIAVVV